MLSGFSCPSVCLTHWGLMLLAEQRPGTVNSLQCPFPWRGWRRSTMLATNGTFAHLYCHQNGLFYLNIYDFMISGCYLLTYEREWHQLTSIHKLRPRIHWPDLPWNRSCVADSLGDTRASWHGTSAPYGDARPQWVNLSMPSDATTAIVLHLSPLQGWGVGFGVWMG